MAVERITLGSPLAFVLRLIGFPGRGGLATAAALEAGEPPVLGKMIRGGAQTAAEGAAVKASYVAQKFDRQGEAAEQSKLRDEKVQAALRAKKDLYDAMAADSMLTPEHAHAGFLAESRTLLGALSPEVLKAVQATVEVASTALPVTLVDATVHEADGGPDLLPRYVAAYERAGEELGLHDITSEDVGA